MMGKASLSRPWVVVHITSTCLGIVIHGTYNTMRSPVWILRKTRQDPKASVHTLRSRPNTDEAIQTWTTEGFIYNRTPGKILNRYDFSLNKLTSNNLQWQLSSDFHKYGGSYQSSNCLNNTIYTPILDRIREVIFQDITLRIPKIL